MMGTNFLGATFAACLGCQKPSPTEGQAAVSTPSTTAEGRAQGESAGQGEREHDEVDSGDASAPRAATEVETEPWALPDDYLQFDGACREGPRITVGFLGDMLLHRELQKQAYAASESEGAQVLWADIADLIAEPDITYLNFEGVMAPGLDRDFLEVEDPGRTYDRVVYTGYPRFNYHPSIARDLVRAGVDLVSTANNHALDRGPAGVDATVAALRKAKLPYFGTHTQGGRQRWQAFTDVGERRIAWIACTNHTNRVPDDLGQVVRCAKGEEVADRIQRVLARGKYSKRDPQADAVIVTPHWGKEYVHFPREREQALARAWVEAGALAVVGSHPHVVQTWERMVAEDGREALVFYSLGNFVSHQPELSRRTTLMLFVELVVPDDRASPIAIAGVRYVPLHVRQDGKRFFAEAIDRSQGPADARALVTALLGEANLAVPDEPKRGDPHCDPDWRPHPIPEWAELDEPFVIPGTEPDGETETGTAD